MVCENALLISDVVMGASFDDTKNAEIGEGRSYGMMCVTLGNGDETMTRLKRYVVGSVDRTESSTGVWTVKGRNQGVACHTSRTSFHTFSSALFT
jgi:hypothetical protein